MGMFQEAGKVVVAYVSKGGASEKYAGIIAGRLNDLKYDAQLVDLRRDEVHDLSQYGSVVVGAGVRMGMVYGKAKKLLKSKDIAGKSVAVFLCSGMAVEDSGKAENKYMQPFVLKCGVSPILTGSFPGTYPAPRGNSRDTTDPQTAMQWAEELASRLGTE